MVPRIAYFGGPWYYKYIIKHYNEYEYKKKDCCFYENWAWRFGENFIKDKMLKIPVHLGMYEQL